MKVVINRCFGGFSLSKEGLARYCEIKNIPCWIEDDNQFKSLGLFSCWTVAPEDRIEHKSTEQFYEMSMDDRREYNLKFSEQILSCRDIHRDDPALIQLIEENPDLYSGRHAELTVVEIPDDVEWEISEYDGREHVAEKHRVWY